MTKDQSLERIFKTIFGELISNDHGEMTNEELASIAYASVKHFEKFSGKNK